MKRFSLTLLAALLGLTAVACSGGGEQAEAAGGGSAATQETTAESSTAGNGDAAAEGDDFSYALGMNIAGSLQQIRGEIDTESLARGLTDALSGETRLTPQQADQILQAKAEEIRAERMAEQQQQAQKNLKQSQAFLEKNRQKSEVEVTESGLQYQVLREGEGQQPTVEDVVVVDYKGMLPNGTVFDSSYKRGEPATFPVNAVIPGWTEALQMMHVGSKYRLVIPPKLAYGEQGAGQAIGPNQVLIFEVELKDIKGQEAQGDAGARASDAPAAGSEAG